MRHGAVTRAPSIVAAVSLICAVVPGWLNGAQAASPSVVPPTTAPSATPDRSAQPAAGAASHPAGDVPGVTWGAGAGRLADGRVLVYGGVTDIVMQTSAPKANGSLYDPASGDWTATADGPTGRYMPQVFQGPGGTAVVMGPGGDPGSYALIVPLSYDPATDRWMAGRAYDPSKPGDSGSAAGQFTRLADGRILLASSTGAAVYDPVADRWRRTGPMPAAADGMAVVTLPDGRVLAAGGQDTDLRPVKTASIYDPATNDWKAIPKLPKAWRRPVAVALQDGGALVLGGPGFGTGVTAGERYDPTTDTWTEIPPLLVARQEPSVSVLADGRVLVLGGSASTVTCSTLTGGEILDPATDTWSAVTGLHQARSAHLAVDLADGRIMVALGATGNASGGRGSCELDRLLPDSEIVDPTALVRVDLPAAAVPRPRAAGIGAPVAGPRVPGVVGATVLQIAGDGGMVLGGQVTGANGSSNASSARVLDVGLRGNDRIRVRRVASMRSARTSPSVAQLADGTALVVGPDSGAYRPGKERGPNAERYDPRTGRWRAVHDPGGRIAPLLVALQDGGALLVGGSTDTKGGIVASDTSALLFDPRTNRWHDTAPIPRGSVDSSAVTLDDGRVLVAGGVGTQGPIADVFLFDPVSERWSEGAPLPDPRGQASTVPLPDGRVLVIGGNDGNGFRPDAVVYDPATDAWSDAGSFGAPRQGAVTGILVDGRILLAGGLDVDGTGDARSDTAVWDPSTSVWQAGPDLKHARGLGVAVTLDDGRVLIMGGKAAGDRSSTVVASEVIAIEPGAP